MDLDKTRTGVEREHRIRPQTSQDRGGVATQLTLVRVLEFTVGVPHPVEMIERDSDRMRRRFLLCPTDRGQALGRHAAILGPLVVVGVHDEVNAVPS